MVEKARARQVYDELIVAELTAHLQSAAGTYDLIAAADTLVYFGDLQPVCAAAAGGCGRAVYSLSPSKGPAEPTGQAPVSACSPTAGTATPRTTCSAHCLRPVSGGVNFRSGSCARS